MRATSGSRFTTEFVPDHGLFNGNGDHGEPFEVNELAAAANDLNIPYRL